MQTLGTVIKLSGDSEIVNKFKIIIVERFIQEDKNNKLYYDYKGVFYPMGSIEENKGIMFNEEDIEEIYHYGYTDEQDEVFVKVAKRKLEEEGYTRKKTIYSKE